jgi:hypothetical protein
MSKIDFKSLRSLSLIKKNSFKDSKEMEKLKKYDFYFILRWKENKNVYEEKLVCLYEENAYKKYKNIYYQCFDNNDGFYDQEYVFNNPDNYDTRNYFYGDYTKKDLENVFLYKYKYSTKKNGLLHCIENCCPYSLYKEKFIDDYDEYITEYHENGVLDNLYGYSKKLDVYPCYGGWNGPHDEEYYINGIQYSKEEHEQKGNEIIREKKELLINKLDSSNLYYKEILKIISNYIY